MRKLSYLKMFVESLDPRPDLQTDSELWEEVLEEAKRDPDLYGLLHGLRCGGGLLERKENGSLKLDYTPLLDGWQKDKLLADWLVPNQQRIAAVFKAVKEKEHTK
jgi:hypothetical protein